MMRGSGLKLAFCELGQPSVKIILAAYKLE